MKTLDRKRRDLIEERSAWADKHGMNIDTAPSIVAKEAGINPFTVYNWFHNGVKLRSLFVERMLKIYSDFPT